MKRSLALHFTLFLFLIRKNIVFVFFLLFRNFFSENIIANWFYNILEPELSVVLFPSGLNGNGNELNVRPLVSKLSSRDLILFDFHHFNSHFIDNRDSFILSVHFSSKYGRVDVRV